MSDRKEGEGEGEGEGECVIENERNIERENGIMRAIKIWWLLKMENIQAWVIVVMCVWMCVWFNCNEEKWNNSLTH